MPSGSHLLSCPASKKAPRSDNLSPQAAIRCARVSPGVKCTQNRRKNSCRTVDRQPPRVPPTHIRGEHNPRPPLFRPDSGYASGAHAAPAVPPREFVIMFPQHLMTLRYPALFFFFFSYPVPFHLSSIFLFHSISLFFSFLCSKSCAPGFF